MAKTTHRALEKMAVIFTCLIVIATGMSSATAQEPKAASGGAGLTVDDRSRPAPPKDDTLVLIADAEADTKAKTIKETVARAATLVLQAKNTYPKGKEFDKDNIEVEPLSLEDFNRLARFVEGGPALGMAEDKRSKPTLRLALSKDEDEKGDEGKNKPKDWLLYLGGNYTLSKLVVRYEDRLNKDVKVPEDEFTSDGNVEKDKTYRMKTLGRFLVSNVPGNEKIRPVQFIATPQDGLKELPPITIDVPQENTNWMITLKKFSGLDSDHNALFEILADKTKVGNPLVSKQSLSRKLVLGSMIVKDDEETRITFLNNKVTFRLPRKPGSSASRVWIKFPLTEQEVATELAKYRNDFDEYEIVAKIREEKPIKVGDVNGELLVPRTASSTTGTWYELPISTDLLGFERVFTLDQIATWKQSTKETPWQLLVSELDVPGVKPVAIRASDPKANSKKLFSIRAEKVESWPVGLENIVK